VRLNCAALLSYERRLQLVWSALVILFWSRVPLEAQILILRYQLNIQRRHLPKRLAFSAMDRLIFVGLYRLVPSTINALTIVKPDIVIRWRRTSFRAGTGRFEVAVQTDRAISKFETEIAHTLTANLES
jgi:hypothetical protein